MHRESPGSPLLKVDNSDSDSALEERKVIPIPEERKVVSRTSRKSSARSGAFAFHPWPRESVSVSKVVGFRPIVPAPERPERSSRPGSLFSRQIALSAYRCGSCSFVTRNKKLLNCHMVQSHSGSHAATDVKPFSCNYCRYRCKSPTVLSVHVESVHYTDTLIDKIANR